MAPISGDIPLSDLIDSVSLVGDLPRKHVGLNQKSLDICKVHVTRIDLCSFHSCVS